MLKQVHKIEFHALGSDACKELMADVKTLREKYENSEVIEMIETYSSTSYTSFVGADAPGKKHNNLLKRALQAIGIR